MRDGRQALIMPKLASTQDHSWGEALVSRAKWVRIVSSLYESEIVKVCLTHEILGIDV